MLYWSRIWNSPFSIFQKPQNFFIWNFWKISKFTDFILLKRLEKTKFLDWKTILFRGSLLRQYTKFYIRYYYILLNLRTKQKTHFLWNLKISHFSEISWNIINRRFPFQLSLNVWGETYISFFSEMYGKRKLIVKKKQPSKEWMAERSTTKYTDQF